MIVSYPSNNQESNAIKAVLKALNVRFKIKKDKTIGNAEPTKQEVLQNIKIGFEEVKLIESGKLKGTSAKDFLNEL